MARIRTVKPEFWTDERLVECPLESRLLFIGLFNFSDDNGNLIYSSQRIKMQVFPADVIDVVPLIKKLITHGLLIEYTMNGVKYLHIKGFKRHQVINRPSKTSIPEPILSECSLTEGKGREGIMEEEEKKEVDANASTARAKKPKIETSFEFEEFWKDYPRTNCSRSEAWKAYKRAIANGADHETIRIGLGKYREFLAKSGSPAAHATTWLNNERWTVDYAAAIAERGRPPRSGGHVPAQRATWKSEGDRLREKYRLEAEQEEQAAAGDDNRANLRLAEAIRQDDGGDGDFGGRLLLGAK